ncbi:DNA oxidative demethylase ALKBH2-like isoform X1 [Musa acuminata AAA Group]|uniref:DNA oxidative demethylase ALKBH2-like isoform X1 n=1 Tax=Musa acuminata AAA Group TaxID=214697 RepID=UPI0031DD6F88
MSSRIRFVEIADANPNPSGSRDKQVIDLGDGSEVVYIPRFISRDQAWEWCEYLDKEIPWTRPSIHVFGRSCLQPRETCYIADEGLAAMRYSGYQPNAYSWDDYPILKDILKAVRTIHMQVYEALPGSKFNTVLLNRYKSGSDYVAWHSDEDKLYGSTPEIASVSFGCEREFLLRKKPSKKPASRSAHQSNGKQHKGNTEQHAFVLKHGSLLLMKGYTQRDWVHSVPKRMKADSVRINLTFRCILT